MVPKVSRLSVASTLHTNENFTKFMLVTEEATFTRHGVNKSDNNHVWQPKICML